MSDPATRAILVLTTAGSPEQAQAIAGALVERRLAACVNVVSNVCSVYRWKGELAREEEALLVIKTEATLFSQVQAAIRELHTYELPEVVAVQVADGDPEYLAWLSGSLQGA